MGAEQLYRAYQSSGLTLEQFEGPRYQRIAHIEKLLADGVLDANLRYVQPLRNERAAFAMSAKLYSVLSKEISGINSLLRTWAKKSSTLPPEYSPFVGASLATALGERYAKSDRVSCWSCAKIPRELRSLTGRFHASRTSMMRT